MHSNGRILPAPNTTCNIICLTSSADCRHRRSISRHVPDYIYFQGSFNKAERRQLAASALSAKTLFLHKKKFSSATILPPYHHRQRRPCIFAAAASNPFEPTHIFGDKVQKKLKTPEKPVPSRYALRRKVFLLSTLGERHRQLHM